MTAYCIKEVNDYNSTSKIKAVKMFIIIKYLILAHYEKWVS